jgi:hypothetical protein
MLLWGMQADLGDLGADLGVGQAPLLHHLPEDVAMGKEVERHQQLLFDRVEAHTVVVGVVRRLNERGHKVQQLTKYRSRHPELHQPSPLELVLWQRAPIHSLIVMCTLYGEHQVARIAIRIGSSFQTNEPHSLNVL